METNYREQILWLKITEQAGISGNKYDNMNPKVPPPKKNNAYDALDYEDGGH